MDLELQSGITENPQSDLFFSGCLEAKANRRIGIAGSRRAKSGLAAAFDFAAVCSQSGYSVVSGLALGCDTAAHLGCLEAGGHTIAVLPCGLNHVAPASNRSLAERILLNDGCLASEYPPDTPPRNFRFVERNRVISSLSCAVVIMEAEERSGSLHSARFALEQGKPLACYIPESGRLSSGCRLLLENHGAVPLRNAAGLASFLETLSNTKKPNPFSWQGRGEGGWRV